MSHGAPQPRIFLRPLASALPLGLFSFGVGMLLIGADAMGWVKDAEASQIGLLLLTFVFPAELVAGIFAFLARDPIAASVLNLYAASWAATGLVLITSPPSASHAFGFFLIAFSAPVFAMAIVAGSGKPLLAVILAISAARALLQGIWEFSTHTGVERAAGVCALTLAGLALYGGLAFLFEDVLQKRVLPLLRIGAARDAVDGPLDDQLRALPSEAGIRQQL